MLSVAAQDFDPLKLKNSGSSYAVHDLLEVAYSSRHLH
jgi:hypothetical protein